MCLVADAHSPKAWTTLWMVTACIVCTKRVFASTITPNASYRQCLQGAPNEILMEKCLMTSQQKYGEKFLPWLFALLGISKLGPNFSSLQFLDSLSFHQTVLFQSDFNHRLAVLTC